MKIPTSLKHKPVWRTENYENVMADTHINQMQKVFPWVLLSGMIEGK